MGILTDGESLIENAISQVPTHEEIRETKISEIMTEQQELLDLPEYYGDVEEALLHHFHEYAFDDLTARAYLELDAQLKDEEHIDSRGFVPVYFDLDADYETLGRNTGVFGLVMVNPHNIQFHSSIQTDLSEAPARRFSLVGDTSAALLTREKGEEWLGINPQHHEPAFLLSRSRTSDDGQPRPTIEDNSFGENFVNRLVDDSEYKVGWQAIESHLLASVPVGGNMIPYLISIRSLLMGATTRNDLYENIPRLTRLLDLAGAAMRKIAEANTLRDEHNQIAHGIQVEIEQAKLALIS